MTYIPSTAAPNRRHFLTASGAAASLMLAGGAQGQDKPTQSAAILGPILGDATPSSMMVWMRVVASGRYILHVRGQNGEAVGTWTARASAANDHCIMWTASGLNPATRYHYRVMREDQPIADAPDQIFTTPPAPHHPSKVTLAISSCAREDASSRAVWNRMAQENVDAVLLLGDTPYIDSTRLADQMRRHDEFAAVPEYQKLLQSRPCWWTWDDHDFAGNDSSGLSVGKENSRHAFTRYRPQRQYGDGQNGIYTSFRYGAVEVFLLDTRWFAMTQASFADPVKPGLLGNAQWQWLQQGLISSTAPFKILASGIIWDDKENSESDDWGTYRHELDAIRRFIGDEKISGVILMGGDIHASRVLRYPTKDVVGYDLVQFIASPIHGSVISSLNVFNKNLLRSAVEPNVFLRIEVDSQTTPPALTASLINAFGATVFSYEFFATELMR